MPTPSAASLTCEIVSDIICPWCFLGHARLEQGLAEVRAGWRETVPLRVGKTFVPHLLMPGLDPDAQVSKRQSYAKKFGGDARRVEAMEARMRGLFEAQTGGRVKYTLDGRLGSSLHAHRVAELARDISQEHQTRFVLEMMKRYHEEGGAVDLGNLQDAADACGLGISSVGNGWAAAQSSTRSRGRWQKVVEFPLMSVFPSSAFPCRRPTGRQTPSAQCAPARKTL